MLLIASLFLCLEIQTDKKQINKIFLQNSIKTVFRNFIFSRAISKNNKSSTQVTVTVRTFRLKWFLRKLFLNYALLLRSVASDWSKKLALHWQHAAAFRRKNSFCYESAFIVHKRRKHDLSLLNQVVTSFVIKNFKWSVMADYLEFNDISKEDKGALVSNLIYFDKRLLIVLIAWHLLLESWSVQNYKPRNCFQE